MPTNDARLAALERTVARQAREIAALNGMIYALMQLQAARAVADHVFSRASLPNGDAEMYVSGARSYASVQAEALAMTAKRTRRATTRRPFARGRNHLFRQYEDAVGFQDTPPDGR